MACSQGPSRDLDLILTRTIHSGVVLSDLPGAVTKTESLKLMDNEYQAPTLPGSGRFFFCSLEGAYTVLLTAPSCHLTLHHLTLHHLTYYVLHPIHLNSHQIAGHHLCGCLIPTSQLPVGKATDQKHEDYMPPEFPSGADQFVFWLSDKIFLLYSPVSNTQRQMMMELWIQKI